MGAEGESEKEHKPFEGKKVYFSNSLSGVQNIESNFGWHLVQFMKEGGADVLTEFVAARSTEERNRIFFEQLGFERKNTPESWKFIRRTDTRLVDESTHLVAEVSGASHGVGMEIERALLKPERGLNLTPALALVRGEYFNSLTWMIKGIDQKEAPGFELRTYRNLEDAISNVHDFLVSRV